ncbi:MAG: preprotein translocase subunit SecA [Alphaproteobacteria bacterium]|nr:preprotein translocase subunit SecA [Alphaproteobacteria bacterium]
MLSQFLKAIFGSHNDRIVKKYFRVAAQVNELEESIEKLSDDELRGKTEEFKQRLEEDETLDDILPEAFAVAREGAKRALGLRPFDVQLVGAQALHNGMISEMKTGEGKTLVAAIAAYLNALDGKGVHVVTVNDYLAKRDAEWMGKLYKFLGLTVGTIVHGLTDEQRREQYACDITYATNNELGFDYLRDNMKFYASELVMRPFNYAIVDEVDSILIDEARTPLIISGAAEDSADLYVKVDAIMPNLVKEDYEVDEKQRNVTLTEAGNEHVEQLLIEAGLIVNANLYDVQNIAIVHHVNNAIKAHFLFRRDVDYIVKNNKVIIIDEFTGRMMEGRRYSDGLHQAIEAKEHVKVEMENQTLASITFQNFFRMYKKLSGMTGTAATEAQELSEIYKVETLVIPTNVPVARKDYNDEIYRTAREKYNAIIELVRDCHARKQPVLVGTVSIEKSELLSKLLTKAGIEHNVLNARYHDIEAQIIAEAGRSGAVTIATNMAGRGTDIKLGGNLEARLEKELAGVSDPDEIQHITERVEAEIKEDEQAVKQAGGLYVVGTERHESRRIDNQLRGRSGRQGDPGASKFFLSLEDDLMRIFGMEKLDATLKKLGIEEGEAITHPFVNKAIEKAQMRVEARNYDIRKHLLKFDDVMNDQRKVIYTQRHELMVDDKDFSDDINDMREEAITDVVYSNVAENTPSEFWDYQQINDQLAAIFGNGFELEKKENMSRDEAVDLLLEKVQEQAQLKEKTYTSEVMRYMERTILLRLIDQYWKEHLLNLDRLRQGINLRAYGQRDPLNEYKQEAFALFENMSKVIRRETVRALAMFEFARPDQMPDELSVDEDSFSSDDFGGDADLDLETDSDTDADDRDSEEEDSDNDLINADFDESNSNNRNEKKKVAVSPRAEGQTGQDVFAVSRNALCPCGSGKKYKYCHGRVTK